MKNNKLIPSLVIALFITGLCITPFISDSLHADQVHWMKYDQALEKARSENKHILVNFTTSWCGWCKKMKATTYEDAVVLSSIDKDFVCAKVDGDSYDVVSLSDGDITEKGLTRQFGVTGYPTTWFLEPDGSHIAPAPGYVDATAMTYILDYVSFNLNELMPFSDYVARRKKLESVRPTAQLKPGMSEADVKSKWGEPQSVNKTDAEVIWDYDGHDGLVFVDGKLQSYRELDGAPKASKR